MRKKTGVYFLLIILVLALGIRLFGLNQPLYDDSQDYLQGIYDPHKFGLNPVVSQPPMISWIYEVVGGVFGTEIWKFRLTNILFGIISLVLTYFISLKLYRSRKGALISVGIMAFSFYHILGSIQLGDEGSILTFFFVSFFYLYLLYKENNSKICYFLAALVFGAALLTKASAVLMIGTAGIYELIINKKQGLFNKIKDTFKIFFPIGLIGLIVFSIFPLLVWLSNSTVIGDFIFHMNRRVTFGFTLMGLSMFLFWATPFIWGMFPVSAIASGDKKNKLPIIWFLVVFLFYTFFVMGGDFSRYYMTLIIPAALVSGNFLRKIRWRTEYWLLGGLVFVFSYMLFNWLNKGVFEYVPRLMDVYLSGLLSFNWDFLFSYTSSSGPLFFLSFKSIIIAFIVSVIIILLFFLYKNKEIKKYFLVAFIGFSLAFNVVVAQEYLFHVNHPDPGEALIEAMNYYQANEGKLAKPIYVNNQALLFYMDHYFNQKIKNDVSNRKYYYTGVYGEARSIVETIKTKEKGGTIFLLDVPYTPRDSKLWGWANECELVKEFKSKGKTFIYVFEC